jgi:hypothetical protein
VLTAIKGSIKFLLQKGDGPQGVGSPVFPAIEQGCADMPTDNLLVEGTPVLQ